MTNFRTMTLALAGVLALSAGAATAKPLTLTGTIRDFNDSHPNFEVAVDGLRTGMVQSALDANGKPVLNGTPGGSYTTQADFAQWYTDVPGVNLSKSFDIQLSETSPGIFQFSDNSFFPIDGDLFGNQNRSHNYHFTYEVETSVAYGDLSQSFDFTGDDDVWVFVNGNLVLDLGGVHAPESASFTGSDLQALGLNKDTNYQMKIFFAERHTVQSNFAITTSFAIDPNPVPPVPVPAALPLLGGALAGLGALRRRRRRG